MIEKMPSFSLFFLVSVAAITIGLSFTFTPPTRRLTKKYHHLSRSNTGSLEKQISSSSSLRATWSNGKFKEALYVFDSVRMQRNPLLSLVSSMLPRIFRTSYQRISGLFINREIRTSKGRRWALCDCPVFKS
jgi:hypothetical protein